MFFLETTPDTSGYMIAGYIVAFSVMAIYVVSLIVRWRNLSQDLSTLETMQVPAKKAAEKPKAGKSKSARSKTGVKATKKK